MSETARTAFFAVAAGLFGLVIGSFLNVVIHRVPRSLSVVAPRSFCPACHSPITARDNVPVISWLLLRGRCRTCRTPIPSRYPLVEALTALGFAGATLAVGPTWWLPPTLVLLPGLLALSAIELDGFLAPVALTGAVLGAVALLDVVAALATGDHVRLLDAGIGLAVGAACTAAIAAGTGEPRRRLRHWGRWSVIAVGGLCLGAWGVLATDASLLAMLVVLAAAAWHWRTLRPGITRAGLVPTNLVVASGCAVATVVGSLLARGVIPR